MIFAMPPAVLTKLVAPLSVNPPANVAAVLVVSNVAPLLFVTMPVKMAGS